MPADHDSMRGILYLVIGLFLALFAIHITIGSSFATTGRIVSGGERATENLEIAEEAFVYLRQLVEIREAGRIPVTGSNEVKSNNLKKRILSNLAAAKTAILNSKNPSLKYTYNKLVNDIYFWQQAYPQKVFPDHPDYQSYLISDH